MPIRIDASDLKQLSRDLRKLGDGQMSKELQTAILASAKPVVGDIRSAVLAIPSKGVTSSASRSGRAAHRAYKSKARNASADRFMSKAGLRQTIARAVKLQALASRGSISLQVDSSVLPPGQQTLPWALEGVGKSWRHPVFGHDKWVQQQPHPYFFNTITSHLPRVEMEIVALMELFAKRAGF
jgi:hypothetical protein